VRRSINLLFTMMLIGVWHGAGWTFVAWGAYNGILLLINQAWQALRSRSRKTTAGRLLGWALTFTAFSAGAVFFRAIDIETSWHLLKAMSGFGDATEAAKLVVDWDGWMIRNGYISEDFVLAWFGNTWSMDGTLWMFVALGIALLVPDTMEITNYREGDAQSEWRRSVGPFAWRPAHITLAATTAIFIAVFASLGRVSEFLYYQF
jgi:alginate O-acetyltransferase complex protein AlgI